MTKCCPCACACTSKECKKGNSGAHAEGCQTQACGECSHAEGTQTVANGNSSHAEGTSSRADGKYAHAEGKGTVASGTASHTEGSTTKACGDYAHAEGCNTSAKGCCSHAEGKCTVAEGPASHAQGESSVARFRGSSAIASGRNKQVGDAQCCTYVLRTMLDGKTSEPSASTGIYPFGSDNQYKLPHGEFLFDGVNGCERIEIPANSTWCINIDVVARGAKDCEECYTDLRDACFNVDLLVRNECDTLHICAYRPSGASSQLTPATVTKVGAKDEANDIIVGLAPALSCGLGSGYRLAIGVVCNKLIIRAVVGSAFGDCECSCWTVCVESHEVMCKRPKETVV